MRQLAIVGEEGQLRVEDLEAGRELLIAPGSGSSLPAGTTAICNWPTWSPDGGRVAYFRHTVAQGEVRENAVCVATADGSQQVTCLASASANPIFMAWSPDGRRL